MKKNAAAYLLLIVLFLSCKKNNIDDDGAYVVQKLPATTSQLELTADSSYLYAKEMFLWNEKIGDYASFNPRQYAATNEVATGGAVMKTLRQIETRDKFSFATSIEESDAIQTGDGTDWGFFVKPGYMPNSSEVNENVRWYLTYVYALSDAGQKQVSRSWYINKINNDLVRYDKSGEDKLNALLFGNATSATIEFVKPDGTAQTIVLNKTKFQANSVLYANVLTHNQTGKKIGYLVFNQFFGAPSRTELTNVFNTFQSQNINELVVDLRNNGGGATSTQDLLANLIAPTSANGKTMYSYEFNTLLQQDKFILLKRLGFSNGDFKTSNNTVRFQKQGSLNLQRVFFIVTENTASASELLINNLKPVMDVKLIGQTTYGKPVGYFPIELFNKVAIYPVSFRTINGAGTADFYTGFTPDKVAPDGVNKDWGDTSEPSLANALNFIVTGSYISSTTPGTTPRSVTSTPSLKNLNDQKFSGMFIER